MRQLTLASLAAEQEVVPFSALGEELRMETAQLEYFILDCEFPSVYSLYTPSVTACKKEFLIVVQKPLVTGNFKFG